MEAEGLHISLPGAKAKRARTGFQTRFNLHGDFDVILSYELLQANRPAMGPAIGLRLTVTTNTPTKDLLILSRISNMQGNGYHCAKTTTDVEGKQQVSLEAFATEVRSGKLRLVCWGSTITFLVAEEGFDRFRQLCQRELGKDVPASIRVVVDPGNADSPPVEVRIRDFEVRAEQASGKAPRVAGDPPVQKAPPTQQPPVEAQDSSKKPSLAPTVQQPAVGAQTDSGEAPRDEPTPWLATAVVLGLLVVCSIVVLGIWLRLRLGRAGAGFTQAPVPSGLAQTDTPPAISFVCPDCGQKLKIRADRAGKKVKCPRCGKAVRVPAPEAGQSEPTIVQKEIRRRGK